MKKIYLCFSIFFFTLLTLITLLTVFIPDKEFSETENRNLAQKPELSIKTISDGSFQDNLGKYLSDQFPLRDAMIKLNTFINKTLGAKNLNGVYVGENGYYFEVIKESDFTDNRKEKNDTNLNAINIFAQKNPSVNTNVFLVPTSAYIYKDYMPDGAEYFDMEYLFSKAETTLNEGIFIDARKSFNENKDKYLYYRTDHHWTTEGAYIAYKDFCISNGITPLSFEEFNFEVISDNFLGSLHSKNLDTDAKADSILIANNVSVQSVYANDKKIDMYAKDKLSGKDKYLVFFGDNYAKTVIETGCQNGKVLLVIKDSYANSFVPLLTHHYEKIIMIDQRYYKEKRFSPLVEEYGVTDTLFMYGIANLSVQEHLASACKN
jgi:hypothetical protein